MKKQVILTKENIDKLYNEWCCVVEGVIYHNQKISLEDKYPCGFKDFLIERVNHKYS